MGPVLIGAGGWGYFTGGLASYADAFGFVEVNATFYRRIPESFARRWRRDVPPDFVFALKAHHEVTHRSRLQATTASQDALAHDLRLGRILRARYLILETPPSLQFDLAEVRGLRDLLSVASTGLRIGLEARAYARGPLPPILSRAMEDLRVLDVVDLSRQSPRVADDVAYTRLFGKGEHTAYEFDDDELRDVDRAGRDAVEVAFTFHGVRMYRDAARFLSFKRTGVFPQATSAVGVESLREVLAEDAQFPATRDDLVRTHGWKVVDLDDRTRIHADRVFSRIPARRYARLEALLREAEVVVAATPPSGAEIVGTTL